MFFKNLCQAIIKKTKNIFPNLRQTNLKYFCSSPTVHHLSVIKFQ